MQTETESTVSRHEAERMLAALERESSPKGEIEALQRLLADSLSGQSRFISIMGFVLTFVMLGLTVFAVVRFFGTDADNVRGMVLWAAVFLFGTTQVMMLKIWFWLNWHRNSVIREIKRMELRLTMSSAV